MKCLVCGKNFDLNPRAKRHQKYCSPACKQKAYKQRKKHPEGLPERTLDADRHMFAQVMERELDEPLEGTLRHVKGRLQQVLDDPGTPASCIAPISRQLVDVAEKLEQVKASEPSLDLLADTANDSEFTTDMI